MNDLLDDLPDPWVCACGWENFERDFCSKCGCTHIEEDLFTKEDYDGFDSSEDENPPAWL